MFHTSVAHISQACFLVSSKYSLTSLAVLAVPFSFTRRLRSLRLYSPMHAGVQYFSFVIVDPQLLQVFILQQLFVRRSAKWTLYLALDLQVVTVVAESYKPNNRFRSMLKWLIDPIPYSRGNPRTITWNVAGRVRDICASPVKIFPIVHYSSTSPRRESNPGSWIESPVP